MASLPCDIVLLPDDRLTQQAIEASRLLADYDPLFTLEIGQRYPHMSLYMFELAVHSVPSVVDAINKIAHTVTTIQATAASYALGEGFGVGYIDPEYVVTPAMQQLQAAVVTAVNPLRSGMRAKDIAKMQDAIGLKLENLQRYGYPAIGELFRPHITLTRLKAHRPEVLKILPDIHTFNGTFTTLGLFEMGDNGTCIRKLHEVELKG